MTTANPFEVLTHDGVLAELDAEHSWLNDKNVAPPAFEIAAACLAILTEEEYAVRQKRAYKRLGVKSSALDDAVNSRRVNKQTTELKCETLADIHASLNARLDDRSREADKKAAEKLLWDYISSHAKVFCCGGVGYILMKDGDGVPIAVTRDGQDFNRFLISVGIHPGSPMRDRIGKFIGTKCYYDGVQTQVRLGFHFEPRNFTAYVACSKGKLIRVDSSGFEEVPNGTDDQIFIFPERWQPLLTKPLDEISGDGSKSDLLQRALFPDGFLVQHLFGGANFEIRNLTEKQIQRLLLAYILFLMMPGVVSERVLMQTLGPSGSGKTFFLDYVGHLVVGSTFTVRPLPNDVREFENQVINEYFIAYDNISSIPRDIKDRFCQAVTGLDVVRRELFTTAQEARYQSKATISLSAIYPPLPEVEHQNRTITINFNEREGNFVAKNELFAILDRNRDDIILNLLRRMTLVLEALWAQRNYVPKVNIRLSSVATFILRIARHEGWETEAQQLLDAWAADQSLPVEEDDVMTAITRWMSRDGWEQYQNQEMTATMLNDRLVDAMHMLDDDSRLWVSNLSWRGNHLVLAKIIARNLKIYASSFGLDRPKSTLRGSRGNHTYRFNPKPELLAQIRATAAYERSMQPPKQPFA
jgi:hypothetical protein